MTGLLYVAADIYGQKVNLQVESAKASTLPELYQTIQQLFSNECYVLRPPGATQQLFSIEKVQIYSDEGKDSGRPAGWKDLVSSSQLVPKAQMYVFQSDPNIEESQQKISRHLSRKPSLQVAPPTPASVSRSVSATLQPRSAASGILQPVSPTGESHSKLRGGYSDYYPASLPSPVTGSTRHLVDAIGSEVSPIRFRSAATGVVATSSLTPRSHRNAKMAASSSSTMDIVVTTTSRTASTSTYNSPLPAALNTSGGRTLSHSSATKSQYADPAIKSAASKHPGEHATPSEKSRYIFALMTTKYGTREIELDHLRSFLEEHHFGMASTIALADLFARCDSDRNSKLSSIELGALFTYLPTLMDSLYFRLLDAEDYAQLVAQLQREQLQLDSILTSQSTIASQVEQLQRESATQTTSMGRLRDAADDTHLQVNERNESIHVLEHECERLRSEKDSCQEDAKRQASVVDQTRAAYADTKRKAEQAEAFSRQSQVKLNSCEERVKELQRMLSRVQDEAAEQQQLVETSSREAAQLRQQESDLAMREKELLQGLAVRKDRAQELDIHVQRRRQQVSEHRDAIQRLEREVQELNAQRTAEEHKLQRLHHSEKEAHQQLSRLSGTVEQQEEKLRALEDKLQQFNERRMAMEQKERPLLEQELMLRSHRDALDEQEQRLKREVGSLFYGLSD